MNKKIIWPLIGIVAIISALSFYHFYERAFPLVHVSITMDAKGAKEMACNLALENGWNLQGYDSEVQFVDDSSLQAFVELEGGGKEAFINMLEQKDYMPYLWKVRFFKEKEIRETFVWFTPDGHKNSFRQIVSEEEEGNNISEVEAQKIADTAAQHWNYDIKNYHLVEHNEKIQKGKRLDHTFVYERSDISLEKGLYRLRVVVAGDQAIEVYSFVKIPDEFHRRYAQMSSTNNLIAIIAKGLSSFLYGFIFGLFGLFILYRKRSLLINENVKVLMIAIILGIISWVNWIPQIWTYYVTTMSKSIFIVQLCFSGCISILVLAAFFAISSLIASSFDRYVFDRHIQIFKSWTLGVAGSGSILEQTILGYCCAAIMLGYLVAFYMIATSWGWWLPLSRLFDPNILSLYVPALSPCIRAFGVGFIEEMLFRVTPIAGLLLLMRNSKYKKFGLFIILIAQVLLFAAAHAWYPQQPAYFRIVEMFIPFWLVGYMYYAIGFLPCFIMHFVYDAILMCLPIFSSGLLIQKILAGLLIGLPLWIVLFRIVQQNFKIILTPLWAYNQAWSPVIFAEGEKQSARLSGSTVPSGIKKYAYAFGVIGLLLLVFSKDFQFDTPPVKITKNCAKEIAKEAIYKQFGDIGEGWNYLITFSEMTGDNRNKFVWQEYGKEIYEKLQGSYVIPPHFDVRIVKFFGPVEQRAEEFHALISTDGKVLSLWHKLPEGGVGADLSEAEAKSIAYEFVNKEYGLKKDDIETISSCSVKHESRRDWAIVLRDMKNYNETQGQAHVMIEIAGDALVRYIRYVDVPEQWSRLEQERLMYRHLCAQIGYWILLGVFFLFVIISFMSIHIGESLLRIAGLMAGVFVLANGVHIFNAWEQILYSLHSAQPFYSQIQMRLILLLISAIAISLLKGVALLCAFFMSSKGRSSELRSLFPLAVAVGLGAYGLCSKVLEFDISLHAYAPLYYMIQSKSSLLAITYHSLSEILSSFIKIVGTWVVAQYICRFYHSTALSVLIFILVGIASSGAACNWGVVSACLLPGIVWGCMWYALFYYIYRHNVELLLITLTVMQTLTLIPSMWYHAYPSIVFDVICNTIIILGIVIWGCKKLQSA